MTSFARGMFDTKMVLHVAALQMECRYTEYMPLNYLYKHIKKCTGCHTLE